MEVLHGEVTTQIKQRATNKWILPAICIAVACSGLGGYKLWRHHKAVERERFLESMNSDLRGLIIHDLYDPDSAKFRAESVHFLPYRAGQSKDDRNGTYALCGSINAKNRLGGYIGYTLFYASITLSPNDPYGLKDGAKEYSYANREDESLAGYEEFDRFAKKFRSLCDGTDDVVYLNSEP